MIADDVLPSNEGRGYVERRLLRRAARFGREIGLEKPFLHEVVRTVVDRMGHHYPELIESRVRIAKIILTEEERFQSTLARGMDILAATFERMKTSGERTIPGEELFKLHDTYGFPLDLATDIAIDNGYNVDRAGFEAAMKRQREQARSAWTGTGEEALSPVYRVLHTELGDTKFTGYETMRGTATITAIVKKGARVDSLALDEEGEIILDTTPFYAESGGQIGDTGFLDGINGGAHIGTTKAPAANDLPRACDEGRAHVGDVVEAQVDGAHGDDEPSRPRPANRVARRPRRRASGRIARYQTAAVRLHALRGIGGARLLDIDAR